MTHSLQFQLCTTAVLDSITGDVDRVEERT